MNVEEIQFALRDQKVDGWLFYDHHHRDPIAYRVLGLPEDLMVTRRWFYLIGMRGEPVKLVHRIESGHLDGLPGVKRQYASWLELVENLKAMLASYPRVAMQYSPNNLIPYVGLVDAGTVELVRSFGVQVVTSADLVSRFEATLTEEQIATHFAARDSIDPITAAAFKEIGRAVQNGGADEYKIQQWIREAFQRENIVAEDGPIVAVNANASNPHYEPSATRSSPIRQGDFVLLDIWGRKHPAGSCYYDITWTGVVGREPSEHQREVFEIVRSARDLGVKTVEDAFASGEKIAGWQVDEATRGFIKKAGYGEYFIHRTGHNIGASLHGNGANMDNLETRDDREILPNTCFSIEPGIYLPEFGVRSELNVLIHGRRPEVTGRVQTELVRI